MSSLDVFTYQVEYQDDDDKTHIIPYGTNKPAAIVRARRASNKHMVAYVVACKALRDGGDAAVGHKSFGQGSLMETEGEGF